MTHRRTPNSACATARRLAATALCALPLFIAGCSSGHTGGAAQSSPAPSEIVALDLTSVQQIVDVIRRENLPATGAHETTAATCGSAHCSAAVSADEFTVMKFAHPRDAMIYTEQHEGVFAVEDVVVTFAPSVPADRRSQYQNAVTLAVE